MSAKKGCACCSKGGNAGVVLILAGLIAVVAAVYVAAVVLAGVFSWHGLAYSFWLADAGSLRLAPAVRATTFVLFIELGTVVSLVLDYLDGRRYLRLRWGWAIAHVTLARRVAFAMGWVVVGAATLARDVAAHLPIHPVSRRIGAFGLGHQLTRRLVDLRAACVALVLLAARRRQANPVVATITSDDLPEAITGVPIGARTDDAA